MSQNMATYSLIEPSPSAVKKSRRNPNPAETRSRPAAFDASFGPEARPLAGADEAGRGPLAGPVVAAAVILNPDEDYPGVDDSKKLNSAARDQAYELITGRALAWAWAAVEADEVDRLNPLRSAMLAMGQAMDRLNLKPALTLVDGNTRPETGLPTRTIIKGDAKSLAIGAASIVAKVIRDGIMRQWHLRYPQYGFDRHKGYGTREHLEALRRFGPCPCHRLTFRGVRPEPAALPGLDFGPPL